MPRMDGYEATRALRERENSAPELSRTPVVAMTAHASLQDRERCFVVGMDDYLSKPFRIEQLRCILERWIPGEAPGASRPQDDNVNTADATAAVASASPALLRLDSADLTENGSEAARFLQNSWSPGKVPQFQALVLVVEDDLVIQELVAEILKRFGCRVESVASGRQALDSLTKRRYDMVLMDYEMPDMDGAEATRVIREMEASDPSHERVPIIATTGHGSGAFREKCLTAGMDDHLGKPFLLEKLLAILERWLLKASPEERSAPIQAAAAGVAIGGVHEEASGIIAGASAVASEAVWCLDREALINLRALQRPGSPDLLGRLVETYLKETPPMLERLRDAFERQDHESARVVAHSLKSSSAYLGATHLAAMCIKIESMARRNALDPVKETFSEVSEEFERVRQALLSEL
jgi:CheY-like chemotaxis protein/HPt (histidine-containing phosphotransfer) domain-containing protein